MKFNPEYDDEAGMADNNLETLRRAVDGIDEIIQHGDNLPEWCQEKIAVAKSSLVAVWDYMLSEKERGVTETKKGLYYYVNKRKKAGTSRSKNHPDAPSAQDWKNAAKTAKKDEDVAENKKGVRAVTQTLKTRNPVAKNANAAIGGGAAGSHKNEKKASQSVRGQKHKDKELAYESKLLECLDIITGRKCD